MWSATCVVLVKETLFGFLKGAQVSCYREARKTYLIEGLCGLEERMTSWVSLGKFVCVLSSLLSLCAFIYFDIHLF